MSLSPPAAWTNPRNVTRAKDRISVICNEGNEKILLPLSYVAALIDSSLLPIAVRDDLTEQVVSHLQGHDPDEQAWLEEIAQFCGCCTECSQAPCAELWLAEYVMEHAVATQMNICEPNREVMCIGQNRIKHSERCKRQIEPERFC